MLPLLGYSLGYLPNINYYDDTLPAICATTYVTYTVNWLLGKARINMGFSGFFKHAWLYSSLGIADSTQKVSCIM